MPLGSGEVFAGYTVVRLLGASALGEVYLATHPRLLRQDAIEVLSASASADAEFRVRFWRDVDLATTLWHPHIVGVHDYGEYEGRLWLATDFVDGTDVERLMRDRYPRGMPADEALDIVTAVADALDYAHERQVSHHDVGPAKILLTDAPRRRILLTGFGIPRTVDPTDDRVDQYDLAVTAYYLLSGAPPVTHTIPSTVAALGDTRQDLTAFDPPIMRALATDPRRRFAACVDFAAALRDAAAAVTQARPVIGPAAHAPTEHLDNPPSGSGMPAVFVPAWSAEEPTAEPDFGFDRFEPEFAPTMAAAQVPDASPPPPQAPEPRYDEPQGLTAKSWIVTGVVAVVAITVALAVVVTRGRSDDTASPNASTRPSSGAAPSSSARPTSTGVGGRPKPPTIQGVDAVGEDCSGGYQIDGRGGWASQGVRGSAPATCAFVGSVLKAYWDSADPSAEVRTVVAPGAIPCSEGSACVGDEFLVTCGVEGTDPWITCRGGRDAVVILY
ncbi:MAG: serine/threonine-protein kinase [Mycobacterium sp.]